MSKEESKPAFHGSRVVSTRKESGVEGAIIRRRVLPDGTRFNTYEIDEGMAEKLLTMQGGLVRKHTAINPDNIAKAKELHESGVARADAEKQMDVSSGTYRRLLEAAGVDVRRYTPVITDDNVINALKVTVKYDLRKRGDIIKASKELNVDSRTIRRLLAKALSTYTPEQIGEIRSAEQARLATPEGQEELAKSKAPLPRKQKAVQPPVGEINDGGVIGEVFASDQASADQAAAGLDLPTGDVFATTPVAGDSQIPNPGDPVPETITNPHIAVSDSEMAVTHTPLAEPAVVVDNSGAHLQVPVQTETPPEGAPAMEPPVLAPHHGHHHKG